MHLLGTDAYIATPEDTILAKLEWARSGGSERQVRDVRSILDAQGASLDHAYLARWADAMDIGAEWRRVHGEWQPEAT